MVTGLRHILNRFAPGPRHAARGFFTLLLLGLVQSLPCLVPDAQAETRRILVLRVDFQADSLETTTGDGSFESAFRFSEPSPLDPLPHDSLYVDSHLRYLKHWYGRASRGDLDLEWEIWPKGLQAAYRLDHPMWHYHWNQSAQRTDGQLAELFRHALTLADGDSALHFFDEAGQRRFDTVLVLHAGVGQDFGEDATPHDVPSAWLGPSLDGTPAEHAVTVGDVRAPGDTLRWTVGQGLLVPESENHDSFTHGLAGLLVLQFGHELGLPNLYESTSGRSVIGKWGLMDQGSANFMGLLPAPLDAWSRLWLGWGDERTVVDAADSLWVAAPDGPAGLPRILRIPLSPHEDYLVEYRRRTEAGRDWTWARDREGRWARLHEDFTLSYADTLGVAGDSTGVLVEVGNLDFALPGSGLLVWHVDHRAATAEAVEANTVNDDPQRRGVDLEEGDGVQDLGRDYGLFSPRGSVGLGGPDDPWQQPNTGWIYVNGASYGASDVSLAWDTEPSTATNDGLFTGLRLSHFNGSTSNGEERAWPDAGRFSLSWDLRPAIHGWALCPPLEDAAREGARLQAFTWSHEADSTGTVLLTLVDGLGRSHGSVLRGEGALWPREDGGFSPLPAEWQDGLRELQAISVEDFTGLLAWRGDSLALFLPGTSEAGERLALAAMRHFPDHLRALRAVDLGAGGYRLYVADGDTLRRLDAATLLNQESAPGPRLPDGALQVVDVRDASQWPAVVGVGSATWLRFGDGVTEEVEHAEIQLMGWDAIPDLSIPENAQDSLVATSLLRWPGGFRLYRGSRLLRELELDNSAIRPIQFGPDPGYEALAQDAQGHCRILNQVGVEVACLELGAGHGMPLTASRTNAGGLAVMAAGDGRLSALDAAGDTPATWPRVWTGGVDAPLHLPQMGGQVVGLAADGTLCAWQSELDGPVWSQPRGDANGGMRPSGSGFVHEEAVRSVQHHPAYVWPNPCAELAHFHYVLGAPARVRLTVYDTAGHVVERLEAEHPAAGEQEQLWSLEGVAPGAYFALIEAVEGERWTRKVKVAVLK